MKNIEDFFNGKRILVTGGTGSIGSIIVNELLKFNVDEIHIFSRDEIRQFRMRKNISDRRLKFMVGDIRDLASLERAFENNIFDIVYHTAAMKHVVICEENPIEAVKTNIIGTQNVVDLAKKYKVPKLINISTDKAVKPYNVMGATKFISERIVLNANYTSVRLGNVVNSRGSVIPVLVEEMLKRRQISVTDPNATRFVIRAPEVAKLILKATWYAEGGEIFVPRMKAFKLSDLVEVLVRYGAPKLGLSPEEIKINIIGLVRGEKLHESIIDELEVPYLHILDDFYVIKPKIQASVFQEERLILSSNYAKLVSKEELRYMVKEYLDILPFLM
jgi:FlaA1/EpsC-like NDP-sugar epimerase